MAKIVVVEDDVYMREELLNLLEKSGYDTIGLSDFENAVSEIAAYFPDLILLDINLPFRSGFEICIIRGIDAPIYQISLFVKADLSALMTASACSICIFFPFFILMPVTHFSGFPIYPVKQALFRRRILDQTDFI